MYSQPEDSGMKSAFHLLEASCSYLHVNLDHLTLDGAAARKARIKHLPMSMVLLSFCTIYRDNEISLMSLVGIRYLIKSEAYIFKYTIPIAHFIYWDNNY